MQLLYAPWLCPGKAEPWQIRMTDDRIAQGQFNLYWSPGKTNNADYFSEHHPPAHHKLMRYKYLQRVAKATSIQSSVRGCVSPSGSSSPGFLSTDDVTHITVDLPVASLTTHLINLLSCPY
jgi:hypothetical protein